MTDLGLEPIRRSPLYEEVASELKPFLEDATFDVVAARLGLTADEGLWRLVNVEHPLATGATLRNDLKRHRRRKPVNRLHPRRRMTAPAPAEAQG